jgi:hypothetical protein
MLECDIDTMYLESVDCQDISRVSGIALPRNWRLWAAKDGCLWLPGPAIMPTGSDISGGLRTGQPVSSVPVGRFRRRSRALLPPVPKIASATRSAEPLPRPRSAGAPCDPRRGLSSHVPRQYHPAPPLPPGRPGTRAGTRGKRHRWPIDVALTTTMAHRCCLPWSPGRCGGLRAAGRGTPARPWHHACHMSPARTSGTERRPRDRPGYRRTGDSLPRAAVIRAADRPN